MSRREPRAQYMRVDSPASNGMKNVTFFAKIGDDVIFLQCPFNKTIYLIWIQSTRVYILINSERLAFIGRVSVDHDQEY